MCRWQRKTTKLQWLPIPYMKKRVIDGVEVQRSSGNVFADLGLPDAGKLKIKTGLVIEIRKAIRQQGLTQQEAATRMGITQPKVSGMMRGDFSNLSERKLMDCLNRLGYDIEIKVKPASDPVGHLMLAIP
jgi:predicted XRE-type DNA-binding protein